MKKIFIAIAILAIPFLASSQQESIEKFYNKYVDNEKISDISLNGWILSMASKMSEEEGTEILQKITKLRIMLAEEKDIVSKADVKNLMTVRDEGTRVNFMIREEGENITNVLVIIHGDGEFILLSLEGNLNMEDLKQLEFDVEGGDIFKKLSDDRA
jgi:hypothetical protein